jgi:hypothetical protein
MQIQLGRLPLLAALRGHQNSAKQTFKPIAHAASRAGAHRIYRVSLSEGLAFTAMRVTLLGKAVQLRC